MYQIPTKVPILPVSEAPSKRQENGKTKKSQRWRVNAGKGGGGEGLTTLGGGEVICERRNEGGECSGAGAKK